MWFGCGGRLLVFGLVRGTGAFNPELPSFVLVSRIPFVQDSRGFGQFFMTRVSTFRVGLGVSGTTIVSGSY